MGSPPMMGAMGVQQAAIAANPADSSASSNPVQLLLGLSKVLRYTFHEHCLRVFSSKSMHFATWLSLEMYDHVMIQRFAAAVISSAVYRYTIFILYMVYVHFAKTGIGLVFTPSPLMYLLSFALSILVNIDPTLSKFEICKQGTYLSDACRNEKPWLIYYQYSTSWLWHHVLSPV